MNISLQNIGKRYNHEWIFRKVDLELKPGEHCAILGGNGSGKSTLLQVIAGNLMPSEGTASCFVSGAMIHEEDRYRQLSFAAPYLDLYEDFSLKEAIGFHADFKPFYPGLDPQQIISMTGLEKTNDKPLRYYSSGMKQKVKLVLAILSDTPLLLLDEPVSNLDKKAIEWYQELMKHYSENRLVLVASNLQEQEYFFCRKELKMESYKIH